MIVTTSNRGQKKLENLAKTVATKFNIPYIPRGKYALEEMIEKYQVEYVILVASEGVKCIFKDQPQDPFFFHPSSAMFRIKRLLKGEHDPFIVSTQLNPGKSFLDCTLGLASDSIVASFVTGEAGKVVGLESEPLLSFLVQLGLQEWKSKIASMNEAMQRIEVIPENHIDFLQKAPNKSYDVVYFDPMFDVTQEESTGIAPLKRLANYQNLNREVIEQAKRVAKERVVMKESSYSNRFEELGFQPIQRKYASHWFGVIELRY